MGVRDRQRALLGEPQTNAYGLFKSVFPLAVLFLVKFLNVSDETFTLIARATYLLRTFAALGVVLVLYFRIRSNPQGDDVVKAHTEVEGFQEREMPNMSVKAYDMMHLWRFLTQTMSQTATVVAIHIYMGYVQPLFLTGLIGFGNLYDLELVKIYMRNINDEQDKSVKRPFASTLSSFWSQVSNVATKMAAPGKKNGATNKVKGS